MKTMNNEARYMANKEARRNNLNNRIYNGTAELGELLSAKNINFSNCNEPIRMLQRIYNAESKVGFCTVVVTNITTIKVTEDNLDEFKKAIKPFGRKNMIDVKDHKPYRTMWIEGVNKFSCFDFETGNHYVYYLVSKTEIKEFVRRLNNMHPSKFTIEDAKAIQEDMAPFARAWQESSIDITKDKNKHFGAGNNFDDIFNYINVTSTFLKNGKDDITLNLNETRHAKRNSQEISFNISLPQPKVKKDGTTEIVLEDTIGEINLAIKDAAEEFYNECLAEDYTWSSFDFYKEYVDTAKQSVELAYFIKSVFDRIRANNQENIRIKAEQYEEMRNAIYTVAKQLNVKPEDVVKIALSVTMNNVYRDKDTREINVASGKVEKVTIASIVKLFPNEFYQLRTGKARTEELNICELYMDIEDDARFEFVNGVSTGEYEDMISLTDATFTGVAYEKNGSLVYDIDAYDYEEVKVVISERTFAKGNDVKKVDNGEYAKELIVADAPVVIKGAAGNVVTINGAFVSTTCIANKELKGLSLVIKSFYNYKLEGEEQERFFIVLQ